MMRNSSVKYEDQTIKILGNDSPRINESTIKRKTSNNYHHKENSSIKVFDTTSEEEAHSSKDSDYFCKHTTGNKNSRAVSRDAAAHQDGNNVDGSPLTCVDKTKTADDDCECCSSHHSDSKKRQGFREIFRNAISRIFDELFALVNGREKGWLCKFRLEYFLFDCVHSRR